MKKFLLPAEGNFYKANLHMHTTVSDGKMTPEEVKAEYMKRGYSIIAYTDHEALVPHNELSDENFLAITSYEVATNELVHPAGFEYVRTYHLNLYARDKNKTNSKVFTMSRMWPPHAVKYLTDEMKSNDFRREYNVASINSVIAAAKEDGFIVSFNHPNWSLQRYEDYIGLKGLWAVEFYNTGCVRGGFPDTIQPIDDLLAKNERVIPIATDDAHASKDSLHDCFGGFTMVKARSLDYDEVFSALERGDHYSSSGPLINELYLEDGLLHVKTSEAAYIELITERRFRYRHTSKDPNGMTDTTFDLRPYFSNSNNRTERDLTPYFRVNVCDKNGEMAYTRAYFEEDWT